MKREGNESGFERGVRVVRGERGMRWRNAIL